MYRLWLWPIALGSLALWAWLHLAQGWPWLTVGVPMLIFGLVAREDSKRVKRVKDSATESDLNEGIEAEIGVSSPDPEKVEASKYWGTESELSQNEVSGFGLPRRAQITIGLVTILLTCMMLPRAFDGPGSPLKNYSIVAVFGLIAAACLLPRKARGYCGDLVALLVLSFTVWAAFISDLPSAQDLDARVGLFIVLPLIYLYGRYKRVLTNDS